MSEAPLHESNSASAEDKSALRRGWTTGACATAAAKAAYAALLCGEFPDPVTITLPGGAQAAFALAHHHLGADYAEAAVVKDAGDDPDVTHGALIRARVSLSAPGSGIRFKAGPGVGTVTRPGLPLAVGEPAINPVPRQMMTLAIQQVAQEAQGGTDVCIEISIADGERLAQRTLNGRLGILGGLSVLGTTGIVIPFSCAAWINSIHRGIDVAREMGLTHIAGSTGNTSERAVQQLYGFEEQALIDMGDFVGGMLKYLRKHPVPRITIAGGMGKMTKLAQGLLDLHSRRGEVDLGFLASRVEDPALAASIMAANSAKHAFELAAETPLAARIAALAWQSAAKALALPAWLEIIIFDREGKILARHDAHCS